MKGFGNGDPMTNKIVETSVKGVRYTASLPERLIRSLTALFGGMLKESTDFLVPEVLKESTTYQIFIGNLLRYGVENIGRVHGVYEEEGRMDNDYGVKKAVGNGIEMVGIVAVSASPLWVLAFMADATWGVNKYFKRISEELDQQHHVDEKIRFEKREDLLDSIEKVFDSMARNIDTPPLTRTELKENFDELRDYFRDVGKKTKMSMEDVHVLWGRMERAAKDQNRTILEISGAMTIHLMNRVHSMEKTVKATKKVSVDILHEDIIDYYRDSLSEITKRGYVTVVKEEFTPYVKSAGRMFAPDEKMLTDRILSPELVHFFKNWNEHRKERKKERIREKELRSQAEEALEKENGEDPGSPDQDIIVMDL